MKTNLQPFQPALKSILFSQRQHSIQPMKAILVTALMALLSIAALPRALAQGFTSGSDGSYGPMNITSNTTLQLPPDGIYRCTTINIASSTTLRFLRNALNTPVTLLATGNVIIDGTIDISGAATLGNFAGGIGGPGGFDGGPGGFFTASETLPGGAGQGPGGGKPGNAVNGDPLAAGAGGFGTRAQVWLDSRDGETYGSPLLIPLIGGSGGGGVNGNKDAGGGGGGGAILIASSTLIRINGTGSILSRGGPALTSNGGSGGAVRLVAPRVYGTGTLNVGGSGYCGLDCGQLTGGGRIRIDSIFRFEPTNAAAHNIGFSFLPANITSVGSAMVVFPPNSPRLDILAAAGTTIPEGTNGPVFVELPFGANTNQTVVVQARNFGTNVNIRVVLTPAAGDPITYDSQINNLAGNPAQTTVNVGIPLNTVVAVNAWTR
jgi:hypothetical protein